MVAYYYPPLGGAGVQRTLKFAKYLSKLGHNVSILTVLNDEITIKDDTLSDEGFSNITIYRAKQNNTNFLLKKLLVKKQSNTQTTNKIKKQPNLINKFKNTVKRCARSIFTKIYTNINVPDDKISWKSEAVRLGLDIVKKDKIDIIYSTSGPYTSHLIGYELKRVTNIKWIADFRDQWVTNPFVEYSFFTRRINERLERKVVTHADSVISVSAPIISDFIERYAMLNRNNFFVLTNGYDEEDFQTYNVDYKTDKFVITYNGTIYGKRSPLNFLKSIEEMIKSQKIDVNYLLIKFVGKIGSDAMEEINSFISKYGDIISIIDYLPHKASLDQLEKSSALLLIIEDGKGSEGIYTGKVFEYIRSGRIIIGIVPDGVAKDLIIDTNTGFTCAPDSLDLITNAIYNSYLIWKGEMKPLRINWNEVRNYNREKITKNLSEIIEML
jgi:glycosyltransferase involved in cell wall biosynthesis